MKNTNIILILLCILLLGCDNSLNPNEDNNPAQKMSLTDLIVGLPEIKFNLPASLQDGNGTAAGISRGIGGPRVVSEFSSLSGVKSSGWYNLNEHTAAESVISFYIGMLKEAAEKVEFSYDKDIVLGEQILPDKMVEPGESDRMDLGVVRITRASENVIEVHWRMKIVIEDDVETPVVITYSIKIIIEELSGGGLKAESYMVTESSAFPGILFDKFYDSCNSETGEVFCYNTNPDGYCLTALTRDRSGAVNLIDRWYSEDNGNSLCVAWANEAMGGVINTLKNDVNDLIRVEYYDGNGYLVKEGIGDADLRRAAGFNIFNYDEESLNLKGRLSSKPDSFTVKSDTYNTSLICGSETIDLPGNPYQSFYWKNGSEWAPGDRTYLCSTWEWNETKNQSEARYIPAYTIPDAVSYLGKSYYMSNKFPLRYLTINREGFTLKNEETETQTGSWEDSDGNIWDWSFTDYVWWLDNDATASKSGTVLDNSDIPLYNSLFKSSYFIWDSIAGKSIEQKAYYFLSYEDEPEDLFRFTKADLVNSVKGKLEALFNESRGLYVVDPIENLDFPDTSEFPSL